MKRSGFQNKWDVAANQLLYKTRIRKRGHFWFHAIGVATQHRNDMWIAVTGNLRFQ